MLLVNVQSVVPARFRHAKQLVSHDTHTAIYNYKYTFSVEIVPICKEDLICLPPKVSQQHGQIGPLLLCTKVNIARIAHQAHVLRLGCTFVLVVPSLLLLVRFGYIE